MSLLLLRGALGERVARVRRPLSHVVLHEPPAPAAPVVQLYDWATEDDGQDGDR